MNAPQATGPIAWRLATDGELTFPAEFIFAGVAPEALQAHGVGAELSTPFNPLVITTAGRVILVDGGMGALADDAATAGRLLDTLAAQGLEPEDVDDVVITHAHADHVGGLIAAGAPTFSRARHHVPRVEAEFWLGSNPEEGLPPAFAESLVAIARGALEPLGDAGVLTLCEMDAQIAPGVRLIAAPGHTPGHVAIELDNGGDTLLYVTDAVLHELQLSNLDWTAAIDADPAMTVATRRRLFDYAVDRQALVAGFHLPRTGRLSRDGPAYRLEPAG